MDPARWQRVSPLLDELFELEGARRLERLQAVRADDAALADELESLLALEQDDADFLSEPAMRHGHIAMPGSEVGPYRLEHLLGEGGMGQVWLASRADGLYQRRVGLKLLRPGLADTNLRLRFTRERQILARLAHPHIARLLDAGISADGLPYLALEYIDGVPITDYCRDHDTPLPIRLQMFGQICAAVSHAHANLIVHRDLKPSNILVTTAGDVRLLDFGIAKLLDSDNTPERTGTGTRAFTLHYAAPEQIRGEPVTTMTDVYSLGVVLYELLADTKPYRPTRASDAAWEEAILRQDPLRPSQAMLQLAAASGVTRNPHEIALRRRRARTLTGDLDNIVLKALSKTPQQRYPSVEALMQDLLRYDKGRPVRARPQSWTYRLRKFAGRHRWPLVTGSLTALVLAVALATISWQAREAVNEAARAQALQAFMVGVFENAAGTRDGEAVDLRGLLANSVERGERDLANQPRALAEILGVVARLRIGLGEPQEAGILLDQQAQLLREIDPMPASLRLESLTQRGRVAQLLEDPTGCIALMQPALEQARRDQTLLPLQATEFYSQLGRCRADKGDRQSARQLFERALALRREGGRNVVGEVESLMDLAGLHADAGETVVAIRSFSAARDQLHSEASAHHPLLISVHRRLAGLYRAQGQLDRAEQELDTALAVALDVYGMQHATTLQIRGERAAAWVEQGRYRAALDDLHEIHRLLAGRLGPNHANLADTYRALGLVQWQLGDQQDALASLRHVVSIARSGGQPGPIADALQDLAMVLHAEGKDAPAHPLLLEARARRLQRPGNGAASVAALDCLLGEVEIALGHEHDGVRRLEQALTSLRETHGPDHPLVRQGELALARYQATRPDDRTLAATGLSRLDQLARLPVTHPDLRETFWRARAYAAQQRCPGPDHDQAAQELQSLYATVQQARPEGGVLLREVTQIRDGCSAPATGIPGAMDSVATRRQ